MNTTYFLNLVSGNVFGSQKTPAIPTKYYLGLSSAAPSLDGSGVVEPEEGTGYARVELTSLSAPLNGVVTNTAAIDFAESTAEFEKLPCLSDIDILRNILYDGVWNCYNKIQRKKSEEQKK